VSGLNVLKAGGALLLAALVQVSIVSTIEVAEGHPDLVLVLLVCMALLHGPLFGAFAGFWAGLALDVASLETLGLTSLLLTLAGYFAGQFGDATTRASAQPPVIAVILATIGVAFGSAVLHFMLGSSLAAGQFFLAVLVPTLALNTLLAYPVYRLTTKLFGAAAAPPREVTAGV
jgi:rod shape-determining protein MreD